MSFFILQLLPFYVYFISDSQKATLNDDFVSRPINIEGYLCFASNLLCMMIPWNWMQIADYVT